MKTAQEFYAWLMVRVNDRGNQALQEVSDFARTKQMFDTDMAAMAALLCWGALGQEEIVKIAVQRPGVRTISGACRLLSTAASNAEFSSGMLFGSSDLVALISKAVTPEMRSFARECLLDLLQSISTDDLLIPLGTTLTQLGTGDERAATALVQAMGSRWLQVGPSTVRAFQRLIAEKPSDEAAFQAFFCNHPQILDPMAVHVWSQPDLHGLLTPDFVVRRADNSYLVVEIETPAKLLMTQGNQLSAEATHAEKQVLDYITFLDDRREMIRQHFPNYRRADGLAVVGLEDGLSDPQSKSLAAANASRHSMRTVGFDWLRKRAAAIVENVSASEVEVTKGYRVI